MKFNPPNSQLRKILALSLVGLLCVKFVVPWILEPLNQKQSAIARTVDEIEDLQHQVELASLYLQQTREIGRSSLHPDPSTAAIHYQDWLRGKCEELGIDEPTIAIKEPSLEAGVGSRIQLSIAAVATLPAAGNLLDVISTMPVSHRISNARLQNWDSLKQRVGLHIDVELLSVQDNPVYNQHGLEQPTELRGLGELLSQRQLFARYQPPQPILADSTENGEAGKSRPTSATRPPLPDQLASIRLVGITGRAGAERALFRDEASNVDHVVDGSRPLAVSSFSASLVAVDSDTVILSRGTSEIRIGLGQTVRQSLASQAELNVQ